MKVSEVQKRVLLTLLEYNCPVHINLPSRSEHESAFYGHAGPHWGKARPSTIHVLHKKGLLKQITGKYGESPPKYGGREGKYILTQEGKILAQKLRKDKKNEMER